MDEQTTNANRRPTAVLGIVFIILGIIFFLNNYDVIDLGYRWWALFFLIPIGFLLNEIWRECRKNEGKLTASIRGSLTGLIVLVTIMLIFLLHLPWGVMWPVFIIIGGLAILLNAGKQGNNK